MCGGSRQAPRLRDVVCGEGRGARGDTCLGPTSANRDWAKPSGGVPVDRKSRDDGRGTTTRLVNSSKKLKSARVGEDISENRKDDSQKITWREMMILLVR